MPSFRRFALSRRTLWTLAILGGLAVRLGLLAEKGTADTDQYIAWGRGVAQSGLSATYAGIYFPLQYDVFRVAVGAAHLLGISDVTALKFGDLICDLAIFVFLILLLRRLHLPPSYALIYWVHPFFLAMFWLGYVDMQVGVLLVLTLLAVSYSSRPWHFIAAGLPLGAMFVMKPQGAAFVYVLVLAAGLAIVGRRQLGVSPAGMVFARNVPLLLVGPVILFFTFSLVLSSGGRSFVYLAHTYSPGVLARQSPSLNADIPNIWYAVAYALHNPGEPIYAVTHPNVLNGVADVLTLAVLVAVFLLVLRRRERSRKESEEVKVEHRAAEPVVHLASGSARYTLHTEESPQPTEPAGARAFTVDRETLLEAIARLGRIASRDEATRVMLALTCMAAIVWPMMLTHVHENHLYYGLLLAIVLLPIVRSRWFTIGIQGLLLLQFVNLAGRYGFGVNDLSQSEPTRWFMSSYTDGLPILTVTALALVCFVLVLVAFVQWALADRRSPAMEPATQPQLRESVPTETA